MKNVFLQDTHITGLALDKVEKQQNVQHVENNWLKILKSIKWSGQNEGRSSQSLIGQYKYLNYNLVSEFPC